MVSLRLCPYRSSLRGCVQKMSLPAYPSRTARSSIRIMLLFRASQSSRRMGESAVHSRGRYLSTEDWVRLGLEIWFMMWLAKDITRYLFEVGHLGGILLKFQGVRKIQDIRSSPVRQPMANH